MMLMLLAAVCAGLFAGAASYINLVEHPARLSCGTELALREFGPSDRRASTMQAALALIGTLAGLGAAWQHRDLKVDRRRRSDMRMTVLAISGMFWASVSGAGQPPAVAPEPSVKLPPDLARVLTDYETGWRGRDAAALGRLFAEDGFVLPNGRPPVRGRAAIQQYYTGQGGPLALRAIAFAADGAVGYIIGGYAEREGEADIGKFTLTLRKGAEGRWLIVSDMDSSNRQPR